MAPRKNESQTSGKSEGEQRSMIFPFNQRKIKFQMRILPFHQRVIESDRALLHSLVFVSSDRKIHRCRCILAIRGECFLIFEDNSVRKPQGRADTDVPIRIAFLILLQDNGAGCFISTRESLLAAAYVSIIPYATIIQEGGGTLSFRIIPHTFPFVDQKPCLPVGFE